MFGGKKGEACRSGSRALQTLITRISQLFSGRDRLLEITEQILKPQFERLEIEFKQMLDASRSVFVRAIADASCRRSAAL